MNNHGLTACYRGGLVAPSIVCLATLTIVSTAYSAQRYVNPGQSVQQVIDSAYAGDEVILRPGTYVGQVNLRGKAITLRSDDITRPELTTLMTTTANTSVVLCNSGETWDSRIEGLTITGGTGSSFVFTSVGGGLRIENASPTIRNCIIRNNSAGGGGGMFCLAAYPLVSNCTFENNSATATGEYGGGAGILSIACSPKFANCEFRSNIATGYGRGGGARTTSGFSVYANCVFAANEAYIGGAIDNQSSKPTFTNCTIVSNHARGYAGAIHGMNSNAVATISSSIIWNNTTVYSTVLYSAAGALFNIDHSIVQGGWTGEGNKNVDPLFKNAGSMDFRLNEGSPCIDAGRSGALPTDFADLDDDNDVFEITPFDMDLAERTIGTHVDMGAFELGTVAHNPAPCPTDLNGDRVVDVFDLIMILERWGPCSTDCTGDLDGNFRVEVFDLMQLLGSWGVCDL